MINPTLVLGSTFQPAKAGEIYGIHTASEGFLRAYIRYGNQAEIKLLGSGVQQQAVRDILLESKLSIRAIEARSSDDSEQCAMYYELPNANHVWSRHQRGQNSYSVCGINHSLSGKNVYENLRDLFLAPAESWDAIICTSQASKAVVKRAFQGWIDYLSERSQNYIKINWSMPVIPLGIDTDDLQVNAAATARVPSMRASLGIPTDALTAIFLGRLNFSSKSHPYPMFLSLEQASRALNREVHLIQAGWFPSTEVEVATMNLAKAIAPSIHVHNVGSVSGQTRIDMFAIADFFISLSDNIQETFGLSVIEAMSCGLPVIVTDWDGYRDTVLHGQTGFLVPTVMAPPGAGEAIALLHGASNRPYNRYLMDVAQATAVDIRQATDFIIRLGSDREMRCRMGHAGRSRAVSCYDWSVIIPQYQALWFELNQRRETETSVHSLNSPRHPDPFALFQDFPTRAINSQTVINLTANWKMLAEVVFVSPILRSPSDLLVSEVIFQSMIKFVQRDGRVSSILDSYPKGSRSAILRSIVWGLKMGIFEESIFA